MRKILIIYPHYPPSNLVGVHRVRLFARHLPAFGWEPHILTVHERHYEEKPDPDLLRLLPEGQKVVKVHAFPVTRPRLVGDIGLRSLFSLYAKAVDIIRSERIDLVFYSIPSFYVALLGPVLHARTGVAYGVDYQDPWVHRFPGSDSLFSRHWWSTRLAGLLEPFAVRKASFITGVAESYYAGVRERNPRLSANCLFDAMPMGGEASDHAALEGLHRDAYVFRGSRAFRLVYAGALLPKAYPLLEAVFRAMASSRPDFEGVEFHFIGSGRSNADPKGFNVRPYAERHGLWGSVVFEYPQRIPYLDVLAHLDAADAVFILGSTESHYTPSKTYQGVLSGKPILAVLHEESTAIDVLRETGAGMVLPFAGEEDVASVGDRFAEVFRSFRNFATAFDRHKVDPGAMEAYSAKTVTGRLAGLLDRVMDRQAGGVAR